MFLLADVRQALTDAGVTAAAYTGPSLPNAGGRYLLLTPAPGRGQGVDRRTDIASLSVRVVGEQGNDDDAEALAWQTDRALRREETGTWGARRVVAVARNGGGPTWLGRDTAERMHLLLAYTVETPAEVPGT